MLVGSLVLALAGFVALAISDPRYFRHAFFFTWYGFAVLLAERLLGARQAASGPFLALAVLHVAAVVPEVGLRLTGFRYESGIEFGYPRPVGFFAFVPHEDLFWTLPPASPGVNSWGFRGPEIEPEAAPDTCRVVVLGDSVPTAYPLVVEALLNGVPLGGFKGGNDGVSPPYSPKGDSRGEGRFEVVNLSQSGYSSHQGRIVAERYGRRLAPQVAVVSYGWNDHWLAWGAIDAEKQMKVDRGPRSRLLFQAYHRLRLLQAARFLATPLYGTERPLAVPRVPREHYRRNLTAMADALPDAAMIYVTPPSSHHRLGVPDRLVRMGLVRDQKSVLAEHRAYNRIVRDVALARQAEIVDLEVVADALSEGELARIFFEDGIHLRPYGEAWAARHVADGVLRSTPDLSSNKELRNVKLLDRED